jgi:hypothetical protein
MSATRNLLRRTVRQACARLERLHEALLGLGRRLHDSIAQLLGSHIGEAVREAILAALQRALPGPPGHAPPRPQPRWGRPDDDYHWPERSRPDAHNQAARHDPYAEEGYNGAWDTQAYPDDHLDEPERQPAEMTVPNRAVEQSPQGWWALVPPMLQVAEWWLQRLPGRPAWLRALTVGAAAAVGAVTAGPLAGALTATATALALLSSLAGNA